MVLFEVVVVSGVCVDLVRFTEGVVGVVIGPAVRGVGLVTTLPLEEFCVAEAEIVFLV